MSVDNKFNYILLRSLVRYFSCLAESFFSLVFFFIFMLCNVKMSPEHPISRIDKTLTRHENSSLLIEISRQALFINWIVNYEISLFDFTIVISIKNTGALYFLVSETRLTPRWVIAVSNLAFIFLSLMKSRQGSDHPVSSAIHSFFLFHSIKFFSIDSSIEMWGWNSTDDCQLDTDYHLFARESIGQ